MNTIENMINEEMVQDVMETVVTVEPNGGMMNNILKNGLYAVAGVAIWEGGKFVAKKVKKAIDAKKSNADIIVTANDFEDQDVE